MKGFIKSIHGLRFIAIFMIFLHHFFIFYLPSLKIKFFEYGFSFVTLFFLISGFLLMYQYGKKIDSNSFSYFKYILKRFIKIFPLHLFLLFISIKINPVLGLGKLYSVVLFSNIFLIQSFFPLMQFNYSFNFVAWFLSALWFCYLVFPLAYLIINFLSKKKTINTIVLIIVIFVLDIVLTGKINPEVNLNMVIYHSPFVHLVEFIIGMLLYFLYKNTSRTRKINILVWTIIEEASLLSYVFVVYISSYIKPQYTYSIIFIPVMSIILFVFSLERGRISQIIKSQLCQRLGSISFEFFILHGLVILNLGRVIKISNPLSLCVYMLIITLLLSVIVHKLFLTTLSRFKKILKGY